MSAKITTIDHHGGDVRLSKTVSTYSRDEPRGWREKFIGHAIYIRDTDIEEQAAPQVVRLPLARVAELGDPDVITVTIEPGDTLNE